MARQKQGAIADEFLSCPVCFDILNEPKTLSCLHRFCQDCLHNYLLRQKSSALSRQSGFQCPVCREFIKAPDAARPPADWAALFKTDFHLKNLIKYVESRPSRRVDRPANPCSVHPHAECDLYCVDCQQIICHLCAGISHRGCGRVITVSEAARERKAEAGAWVKELTAKIKEASDLEKSREKCLDQLDNQKAAAEKTIANMVKELHARIKVAEDKLMKKLASDFESLHGKITVQVLQFENELAALKNKVQLFSSNMETVPDVEILRAASFADTAGMRDGLDIKSYRSFLANVASIKIVLEKQPVPPIHLGDVTIKRAEDDVLLASFSPPSSAAEPKTLLERLRNIGKRSEVAYYPPGDLNVHHKDQVPISKKRQQSEKTPKPPATPNLERRNTSIVKRNVAEPGCNRQDSISSGNQPLMFNNSSRTFSHTEPFLGSAAPTPAQASFMDSGEPPDCPGYTPHTGVSRLRTLHTRLREDAETPKLRDVIVLAGSQAVLVTDWANQCVKAIYGRREKDTRLVLGGKPWAITQVSENLAAVSLPVSTQICVIRISPTLSVQNSFMSAKRYTGLASLSSSMLVASGGSDPPSVDIVDMFGEVLKSFSLDKQGVPLFEYPAYVCVTPAAMILVTDRKQGAVTCLTPTGDIKFRFQPEGSRRLKEPSGIVTDSSGRTLVAESRGLLALTPTGQFGSALVGPQVGLLDDPRGVGLCAGGGDGLVYVTSGDQNVEILRLR